VVKPFGETRPAWKVLRVLGNLMEVAGFDYDSSEQVRNELLNGRNVSAFLNNSLKQMPLQDISVKNKGMERIGEVPIYQSDAVVRRSSPLQKTKDAAQPAAIINSNLMQKLGVQAGDRVIVNQGAGSANLCVVLDECLPDDCVRVAAAHSMTSGLGGMFDAISVVRP
jgi:NADH-quinone oxidoreductase subunit G